MTKEFVTLPSNAVEHALAALIDKCIATYAIHGTSDYMIVDDGKARAELLDALRAALEQPQNHVPNAGNMVPAGWKLVPSDATHKWAENLADRGMRISSLASAISDMLAAAPQPPAPDQPQADQPAMTPIAQRKLEDLMASGYTISGYSVYHERKHQHGFVTGAGLVGWWKPDGVEYPQPRGEQEPVAWIRTEWSSRTLNFDGPPTVPSVRDELTKPVWTPLCTHPQARREPLTHYEIHELFRRSWDDCQDGDEIKAFARAIEAAHNIK